MKLIPVEDLRVALNELDLEDIRVILGTALELITTPIQSCLGIPFESVSRVDGFSLQKPPLRKGLLIPAVNLTGGFIDPLTVVIRYATTIETLSTGEVLTSGYVLDAQRGIVTFLQGAPGAFLEIEYTGGLDINPAALDEYLSVPEWLKTATISYAASVYNRLVEQRDVEPEARTTNYQKNAALVSVPLGFWSMIEKYIKSNPVGFDPVYTRVI